MHPIIVVGSTWRDLHDRSFFFLFFLGGLVLERGVCNCSVYCVGVQRWNFGFFFLRNGKTGSQADLWSVTVQTCSRRLHLGRIYIKEKKDNSFGPMGSSSSISTSLVGGSYVFVHGPTHPIHAIDFFFSFLVRLLLLLVDCLSKYGYIYLNLVDTF